MSRRADTGCTILRRRLPDGGGTPLVLVHGLGARGEDWAAMIPALAAQGFHVYVPDLLGYGRSPKPDVDYSISLEEQTVAQFMQAMHVARADVGGWSMGGWIAMKLALDHPEMVDRLVIYDSAGTYFPATWEPDLFTPTMLAGVSEIGGDAFAEAASVAELCGGGCGAEAAGQCVGDAAEHDGDDEWTRSAGLSAVSDFAADADCLGCAG